MEPKDNPAEDLTASTENPDGDLKPLKDNPIGDLKAPKNNPVGDLIKKNRTQNQFGGGNISLHG